MVPSRGWTSAFSLQLQDDHAFCKMMGWERKPFLPAGILYSIISFIVFLHFSNEREE